MGIAAAARAALFLRLWAKVGQNKILTSLRRRIGDRSLMATLERRSLFPDAPLSDSGDQSPDSIFSALCDERRHSFGSSSSVSIPPPAPHTKVRNIPH